ncbi:6-bladed beta-propeller protein [Segatella bryantii]|nr:6-bladed beta-propeller protein [Segatella bryantii]
MKNLCFITIASIICLSCSNKPEGYVDYNKLNKLNELKRLTCKVENIDLSNSKVLTEQDFMHNYVTEPNYIRLDNSVPLGQIEKIRKYKNNFYILSNDKIYIFNGKGKYLKTIDYKGHGRNEYIVLRDFQILPKENIILGIDDKEKKIFKFSLRTGKCLGTMDEIVASPFARKIGKYYIHSLLYGNDANLEDSHLIIVTDGKKTIAKQFSMPPIIEHAIMENNIYEHSHYATFIPLYSDTVYSINDNLTYYPKYVVKQKKSLWSKKNEKINSNQVIKMLQTQSYTYLSPETFMETKNGIIFSLKHGDKYAIYNKHYLYDKVKRNIYEIQTGVYREKIDRIFPFSISFTDDNSFYGYYRDMSDYKVLLKYGYLKNGQLFDIIKESKKGDNPVLVEFKLKN